MPLYKADLLSETKLIFRLSIYSDRTKKMLAALFLCFLLTSSNHVWAEECFDYCFEKQEICEEQCFRVRQRGPCRKRCQEENQKCELTRCGNEYAS
ncbi:hypothetical protein FGIG_01155 [Fasciola gigantica]|uniref:Uncharacterized protein n=1 Tax=Fasciola gigantica TaxID=46835 RepID=A0A504YX74_FASGI|nr:hypothetical protein FGIG_01155 [Fasciola gigantica]